MTQTLLACRLYLLTPPQIDPIAFAPLLIDALEGGDVAALQLRLKQASDAHILNAIAILQPIAHRYNVAFILNDRPDLAVAGKCDGVHIGDEDDDYKTARRLMGSGLIGVTCKNSRHQAIEAAEAGADYVAFGSFFPSKTKSDTLTAELDLISWWHEMMTTPAVAIGGITPENCEPLILAGADFLAVTNGVWSYKEGPNAAVRAFNQAIARNSGRK